MTSSSPLTTWALDALASPEPGGQCPVCSNLKLDSRIDSRERILDELFVALADVIRDLGLDLHPTTETAIRIEDLRQSVAIGGCRYCAIVFNAWARTEELHPGSRPPTEVFVQANKDRPWRVKRQEIPEPKDVVVEVYAELAGDQVPTVDIASSEVPGLGHATSIATSHLSDHLYVRILEELAKCETSHKDCPKFPTSSPRRLLEVKLSVPGSSEGTTKLVQDLGVPVKYMALSHCWGPGQPFTTTRATLRRRLEAISMDEMPQTFRDAVTVARKLHIPYVWIDSLCIIQDDERDWEIESAKMASVYEDSYLTLAVALSAADHEGFLHRDADRLPYLSLPIDGFSGCWVRKVHDCHELIQSSILSTRAWTLQEYLVPQRLLTLTSAFQLECRGSNWCECGTTFNLNQQLPDSSLAGRHRHEFQAVLDSADDEKVVNWWMSDVVKPYSRRRLTKLSDRLPALSALAAKVQMKLNTSYLAGIWLEYVHVGLRWSVQEPGKPSPTRTPTWSWASIEGALTPSNPLQETLGPRPFSLLSHNIDLAGPNPFGEVSGGSIVVRAMYFEANLVVEPGWAAVALFSSKGGDDVLTQSANVALLPDTNLDIHPMDEKSSCFASITRSPAEDQDFVAGRVACILLFQGCDSELARSRGGDVKKHREFMVLGHAGGVGKWQRVGILTATMADEVVQALNRTGNLPVVFGRLQTADFEIV